MSTKKIGPEKLKQAIIEEAINVNRKKAIYEEVKKLNSELASINESRGMVASFGFATPNDVSSQTKNGFVNDQNIVHITKLAQEMSEELNLKEDVLNEVDKLKEEIAKLKEENEALKSK